jgi:hypothetical protein
LFRYEKVEGLFWLLYSVLIQPADSVAVEMRVSSRVPWKYVFQGSCWAILVPYPDNPDNGGKRLVPVVTAVIVTGLPSI